jgi:hypothetical protein
MYQVEQPPGRLPDISVLVRCFPGRWKHLSWIYPVATLRFCQKKFRLQSGQPNGNDMNLRMIPEKMITILHPSPSTCPECPANDCVLPTLDIIQTLIDIEYYSD